MDIIDKTSPKGTVTTGNNPEVIVLHHYAGKLSPDELIAFHTEKRGFDWAGYHYAIYEDGSVYQFRRHSEVGAHEKTTNKKSIGIALAGNYSLGIPSEAQIGSLRALVAQLRELYPIGDVKPHRAFKSTECPGLNITDKWIKENFNSEIFEKCSLSNFTTVQIVTELIKRLK
jgi:hypothetical protein